MTMTWQESAVFQLLFVSGQVLGFAALMMILGAAMGMRLEEVPPYYRRAMKGLLATAIVAALVKAVAYGVLFRMAVADPFQFSVAWMWKRSRLSLWEFAALVTMLAPHALWWRRVRGSWLGILIVGIVVTAAIWIPWALGSFLKWQEDFVPASWLK